MTRSRLKNGTPQERDLEWVLSQAGVGASYIGVDVGGVTGVAMLSQDDRILLLASTPPPAKGSVPAERIAGVARAVRHAISAHGKEYQDVVAVEWIPPRGQSTMFMRELSGAVKGVAACRHMNTATVTPAALKAFATGRGNAVKRDMMDAAHDRWGTQINRVISGDWPHRTIRVHSGPSKFNEHMADALWLAAWIRDRHQKRLALECQDPEAE